VETTGVTPETRYAKTSDAVHIAYQVYGSGPPDLVWIPGYISNVEYTWQYPPMVRFARGLGSFGRVIAFDKRGTGLSDRVSPDYTPDLQTRMDDVRAVMDAAGSDRAVILGFSEGGAMSLLFAATYPERTVALVEYGASPRYSWAPDFPDGETEEEHEAYVRAVGRDWGTREFAAKELAEWGAPSASKDPAAIEWFATMMRVGASPGSEIALERMNREIDVRAILSSIRVPTLVIYREGESDASASRYMAERIPGAKHVALPGEDHIAWFGDAEAVLAGIEAFVRSVQDEEAEFDRVLATVMFTDIVGSTERSSALGDRSWQNLLADHDRIVRGLFARYRGREIKTLGDGFLATFDGPARAVRCALAIAQAVSDLGIDVRIGLHTGEIELDGDDVRGIAVHIGSRIGALAGPSEVLVSSTVKDLVAGSGLVFEETGERELKGVSDRWRLYRVADAMTPI
jgi:class 3 adenylate cyclase